MTQTLLPFATEAVETPAPAGLAALMGGTIDEGKDVEYRQLGCKTVVGKCSNPAMPFKYSVNPYRGCEFACRYCYARYTHEFMELEDPLAFERTIYAKTGAADAAARDLARRDFRGRGIAIGTVTDPYQPAERRFRITRGILEKMAERPGLDVSITTKSALVLRDLDLLRRISERSRLSVNVSLITLDAKLARRLEPRAPTPDLRLETLASLRAEGVAAGLFAMPVLPGLTDAPADLRALVRRAKESDALWVKGSALFLPSAARKVFYPFLEKEFPGLLRRYRAVFDRATRSSIDYRLRLAGFIDDLCRAEGVPVGIQGQLARTGSTRTHASLPFGDPSGPKSDASEGVRVGRWAAPGADGIGPEVALGGTNEKTPLL